ncbi:Rha family phage regulatory protein [Methylopila jiangsuensis]|nr:phage regulatory protein/antirepressor Ant [Methylopila jiangsuensis]MDR6284566.1 Rha family phage regulatory protein [Methylopila jiangsuensis]
MTTNDMLPNEAERNPIVRIENGEVLADSRDVAAFFGKRHDHVMEAIANLIESGKPENPGLANMFIERTSPRDGGGRPLRNYSMNRDGFTLVAMGFTGAKPLKFKLAYIAAFNAMERELMARRGGDPIQVLNDPAAMRGLLLTYSEKVIALEGALTDAKPKLDALDRISESFGSVCPTVAAKSLNKPPRWLTRWLRSNGWLYRRPGGRDTAYQTKIEAGYLENKPSTVDGPDGPKTYYQPLITPKGVAKLAQIFNADERGAAA